MRVVCMMDCYSKDEQGEGGGASVDLQPVVPAGKYEYDFREFFEATPGGRLSLQLLNDDAAAVFEPGKIYRVTIEEA